MVRTWAAWAGAIGTGAVLGLVLGCGGAVDGEDATGGNAGTGGGGASGGRGGSAPTGGTPAACSGITPSNEVICFELDLGADASCEVSLPPPPAGQRYDYDQVHVILTAAAGAEREVPYVASEAACSTAHGGWYAEGTTILACPCSCASFGSGSVAIRFEC